jgi:hypothetical protein
MFDDDDYGRKVRAETGLLDGRQVILKDRAGNVLRGRLDISKYTNGVTVFAADGEHGIYYDDIAEVREV